MRNADFVETDFIGEMDFTDVHPVSYPMGTGGSFRGGKAAGA
jgi:hypothetical protein